MKIGQYLKESVFTAAFWITPSGKVLDCGAKTNIAYVCDAPRKFGIKEQEVQSAYDKYGEPYGFEGKAREEVLRKVIANGFIRIRKYKNLYSVNVQTYNRRVGKLLSNWAYEMISSGKENDKYMPVNITSDSGNPPTGLDMEALSNLHEAHKPIVYTTLNEMECLVETEFQQLIDRIYEEGGRTHGRYRVDESGISRVVSKLSDSSVEFVIITAFRSEYSLKENQRRNAKLIDDFREELGSIKYGAYKLIGHYDVCSVKIPPGRSTDDCEELGGHKVPVLEEAWCLLNEQKNKNFFDVAVKMANKYDQESFIARTATKKFGLYLNDGTLDLTFGDINNNTFRTGFEKMISTRNYSEIGKVRNRGRIFNIVFENFGICVRQNRERVPWPGTNWLE